MKILSSAKRSGIGPTCCCPEKAVASISGIVGAMALRESAWRDSPAGTVWIEQSLITILRMPCKRRPAANSPNWTRPAAAIWAELSCCCKPDKNLGDCSCLGAPAGRRREFELLPTRQRDAGAPRFFNQPFEFFLPNPARNRAADFFEAGKIP